VAVLGYSLLKTLVARATVDRYGVNAWVFGAIDFTTSIPYGISTRKLAEALLDKAHHHTPRWAAVAATSFIAPDLYVVLAGRNMPWVVYAVLTVWVLLMGSLAIHQLRRQVLAARARALAGSDV
jgi:hypothetical protein